MAKRKVSATTRAGNIRLTITLDDDTLELSTKRLVEKLSDFRRFWSEFFAPQFFDDVQKNFATEGGFVGGWRALSPKYAAWKLKHYGPKPILVRSGAMKESLRLGGRGNIMNATKARGEFGSKVEYMPFHQRGTRRMPRRQVLYFGPTRVYNRLLANFVAEEARAAGFTSARTA